MKSNNPWRVLTAALALFPGAAGAQAIVVERSLSVGAALELATTALEACRKHGSRVTITVLDHAGRTKVVLRDDGSNPHSVEHSLRKALRLGADVDVNPSGGALAANPIMAAGLIRIGEAAARIHRGASHRALAHATSGPCLQQNLVAVLEGGPR